jgi:hypothetical protein
MPSRLGRMLVATSALVLSAVTVCPNASAQPIARCTDHVIDGVEVDTCVNNSNANTVNEVPGVNVQPEFEFGIGIG